jgi:hypothetical protein
MQDFTNYGMDPSKIILQMNALGRGYELANAESFEVFSNVIKNSLASSHDDYPYTTTSTFRQVVII